MPFSPIVGGSKSPAKRKSETPASIGNIKKIASRETPPICMNGMRKLNISTGLDVLSWKLLCVDLRMSICWKEDRGRVAKV